MFFTHHLKNKNGERICMTETENKYMTSSITGLSSPMGTINTSVYTGMDGPYLNNAFIEKRKIVITFVRIPKMQRSHLRSLILRNIPARSAPEILCHTENIAPGTVAIERSGNVPAANVVARPEFCIPISMATAFFLDISILKMIPIINPHRYPNRL